MNSSFLRRQSLPSVAFLLLLVSLDSVHAQTSSDAYLIGDILPQGVAAARLETRIGSANERYDGQGRRVGLADALDGVVLDASTVSLLAPFGPGATLGTSRVSATTAGVRERLTLGLGVTDDLTVGVLLPWGRLSTSVQFGVQPGNLGVNPAFNPALPLGLANSPFLPVGSPGVSGPASTADITNVLTNPAFGFNYRAPRDTVTDGPLDPVVGLRWRAWHNDDAALILAAGYRFGVAEHDDPDDLFDLRLEDGTDDVLLGFDYQYGLGGYWDLGISYQRTWQRAGQRSARARSSAEFLVPSSRTESMIEDKGDIDEANLELGYRQGSWRWMGRVELYRRGATDWFSPSGQNVTGLEANTDVEAVNLWAGVAWSGIDAWRSGRMPAPAIVSLAYQTAVDGRNYVASDNLYLTVTVPFR